MTAPPLRDLLRSLPSLASPLPTFDPDTAPADPDTLFAAWLTTAIDAAVPEPHAMTLSTTDSDGRPSARILILKNLSHGVWQFATSATSRKGTELATTPWAALTFYWPTLGRQIRVRGPVTTAGTGDSAQDFLDRSPAARATALLGNQSQPLTTAHELAGALKITTDKITNDPTVVAPDWTLYGVHATEVEFWQAHPHRRHTRLHYTRPNTTWTRHLLWP